MTTPSPQRSERTCPPDSVEPATIGEQSGRTSAPMKRPFQLHAGVQHEPQILVVSASQSLSQILVSILEESSLATESVSTMSEACALAGSGRFAVILSQPRLPDGSWTRLTRVAAHTGAEFVIILVARKFDTRQWLQALKEGAFEVIDVLQGLDSVEDAVRRALWVGYLTGVGPVPDSIHWREGHKQ